MDRTPCAAIVVAAASPRGRVVRAGRRGAVIVATVLLAAWIASLAGGGGAVDVRRARGRPMYLVAVALAPDDVRVDGGALRDGGVTADGSFAVRVPAARLPVAAPGCGDVVLHMPATDPAAPGAAVAVAAKHALFERLARRGTDTSPVRVVVRLDPHVRVLARRPLRLELTHCDAAFRHARGRYVDHLGPT